jgi:hypothetical protein
VRVVLEHVSFVLEAKLEASRYVSVVVDFVDGKSRLQIRVPRWYLFTIVHTCKPNKSETHATLKHV